MKREQLTRLLLLAATAAMVYLCYQMVEPFLLAIFGAAILVVLFYPMHQKMHHLVKSPSLAAILSTILVLGFIIMPLVFVVGMVVQELTGFYQAAKAQAAARAAGEVGVSWVFDSVAQWISRFRPVTGEQVQAYITGHIEQISNFLLTRSTSLARNVGSIIFNIVLVIFTMFFLFRDRRQVVDKLEQLLPLSQSDAHDVFVKAQDLIIGTIYGNGVVAIVQGSLAGLAFWFVGIPSVVLWTVVMVFFATIPMVGTPVIWLPAGIILLIQGHILKGLFLLAWGAGVVGTIDNFLRPVLIGQRTTLHTMVIFFSVLGGIGVFGPLGVIMGPVVVAITIALIDVLRRDMGDLSPEDTGLIGVTEQEPAPPPAPVP